MNFKLRRYAAGAAADPVWGVMMEVGAMVHAEGAAVPAATNGHSEE